MPVIFLIASVFSLEWNPPCPAGIPYEVEISREKMGASSFSVKADGAAIPVEAMEGSSPGCMRLRFTVPKGTESLTCETGSSSATARGVSASPAKAPVSRL